jgi:hypothetical protein
VHVVLGQRLAGRRDANRLGRDDGIQDVLPGTENLSITADDREVVVERVVVQPGKTTDLGLFRLRPLARILGKVVDDAGEPAQVAFNVFPFDRYAATREALAKRIYRSSPEGNLKIDSVGRGRYLILANEEGWVSTPALGDTTLGDHEDLVIHVSKGTPVALRLRADPLPGTRLEIRTRTGLPVADRNCPNRDPMKFVLVPGTYSIELWDGETWLASKTLAVGTEPCGSTSRALALGPALKPLDRQLALGCSTERVRIDEHLLRRNRGGSATSCDSPAPSVTVILASLVGLGALRILLRRLGGLHGARRSVRALRGSHRLAVSSSRNRSPRAAAISTGIRPVPAFLHWTRTSRWWYSPCRRRPVARRRVCDFTGSSSRYSGTTTSKNHCFTNSSWGLSDASSRIVATKSWSTGWSGPILGAS